MTIGGHREETVIVCLLDEEDDLFPLSAHTPRAHPVLDARGRVRV